MKIVSKLRGATNNSGFTLIELVLSMGILMILIGILTTVFGQILDVQINSKSVSTVDQNGRYILARLMHDMQSASSIASPSAVGQSSNTLKILVNSIDYTYSVSSSGNFVLVNNNGTDALNTNAASISGVTFTRLGNGSTSDTVRVGFTVTSRAQRAQGSETKNFQTTLGLQ